MLSFLLLLQLQKNKKKTKKNKKKKKPFCLSYSRYTDTAIIRTLVRQLPTIDRTQKEFVFSKYRKN